MTRREDFLRAIEEAPEEDMPRLVYADWLEEQGDTDRAKFIRLQCQAERIIHSQPGRLFNELSAKENAEYKKLDAKADKLRAANLAAWTKGLPKWALDTWFERGFTHFFWITGKQLVDDGAALRAVSPLAGYLSLRLLKGREKAVFECEHLAMITRLNLESCQLNDDGVKALLASKHLTRVVELDLGRGLDSMDEDANRLSDKTPELLAEAKNLPALTELDISGYQKITAAGVRAIVESARLAKLVRLDISRGPGGPKFAEVFLSPKFKLKALQDLDIGHRKLGDAGAAVLARCSNLSGLKRLALHENGLTDAGARALLESPHLQGLTSLYLWKNPKVTDVTAAAILASKRKWENVELKDTGVSEKLVKQVNAKCGKK